MSRAIVNYASGYYVRGAQRLENELKAQGYDGAFARFEQPRGWPSHQEVPFGFKAYALNTVAAQGVTSLLWCDSCIVPIRPLGPIWEAIERDGYLIWRNGFRNSQWTADSAYPALFPELPIEEARAQNRGIEHVVAGCFGIDLTQPVGRNILREYYRLATDTDAFIGPVKNTAATPCGPEECLGHRHDQTALSVIAWRLGCKLTDPPNGFGYAKYRGPGIFKAEDQDERAILIADGAY